MIAHCKKKDENSFGYRKCIWLQKAMVCFILLIYSLEAVVLFFCALGTNDFLQPQSYVSFHFLLLSFALAAISGQSFCSSLELLLGF